MDTCRCDVSFLTVDHARPGPITCGLCGGSWISKTTRAPYALNADAASRTAAWLRAGGEVALVWGTGHVVYVKAEQVVRAPGRARLERCPACARAAASGLRCADCDGVGYRVWHACVGCGDEAMWEYTDDARSEMACRACGAQWTADDPRWLAQRVPAWMLATEQSRAG